MRRNVCPGMAFSNGMYIFAHDFNQISPAEPEGIILEKILSRQVNDEKESLAQKHRAEVAHNIDINKDGVIGEPESSSALRKRVDKAIKSKRKRRSKVSEVSSSDDVSVSDNNNKVPT